MAHVANADIYSTTGVHGEASPGWKWLPSPAWPSEAEGAVTIPRSLPAAP